ncbi:MAG TPA: queuosine precursor transporter [Gemmatimonadales bacterium]
MTTAPAPRFAPSKAERFSDAFSLLLSGIFLTSLTVGNIIGVTKFVDLGLFVIPAGLLAYPITFLATDLMSEIYGRRRAQQLVWIGFVMNIFMLGLVALGHVLPDASGVSGAASTFDTVYDFMKPNVVASMIAYLVAQSLDVQAFHFWKRLTKGRHLWLRNNFSTIGSQLVDTMLILSILYASGGLGADIDSVAKLVPLMLSSYAFKVVFALLDTPFFYLGVYLLKRNIVVPPDAVDE